MRAAGNMHDKVRTSQGEGMVKGALSREHIHYRESTLQEHTYDEDTPVDI